MNVYKMAALGLSAVRGGENKVNGNSREKIETEISDRLQNGRRAPNVNKDKA